MKLIQEIDQTNFDKATIHDIGVKLIPGILLLQIWKVTFSYKTKRGNKKENHRYLIAYDEFEARCKFFQYIDDLNEVEPYRALLNAKILSIDYVGTVEKSIN